MNNEPPITPPAHVRRLEKRVEILERAIERQYSETRDLAGKVDKNHIVMLDNVGELARMIREIAKKVGAKL